MGKRKLFVIADTETVTDARILLDIAWIVCDTKGNILERFNAIPQELLNFPFGEKLITSDRFTSRKDSNGNKKSEWYLDSIHAHSINAMSLDTIKTMYHSIGQRYNGYTVFCAYNAFFDANVLNNNCQVYGYGNFFSPKDKILDIWHAALSTICDNENFALWAWQNKALTKTGNIKTSAETIYRYIQKDVTFEEKHTALADCEIEKEILFKCRRTNKKLLTSQVMPVSKCEAWLKLQARLN